MISGILLAAGDSERMGTENKLLLPFQDKPLFLSAMQAMKKSMLDELIIVVGHDYKKMLPFINDSNIKIAINGNHLEGQTSSIKAGIQMCNPSSKAFMICLADMPLLTSEHLDVLIEQFEKKEGDQKILRPFKNNIPGNPIIFCKSYFDQLYECDAPDGCKPVVEKNKSALISFNTSEDAYFMDVDTPSEYAEII